MGGGSGFEVNGGVGLGWVGVCLGWLVVWVWGRWWCGFEVGGGVGLKWVVVWPWDGWECGFGMGGDVGLEWWCGFRVGGEVEWVDWLVGEKEGGSGVIGKFFKKF